VERWTCALKLDTARQVVSGSPQALAAAVGHGADLRIYTEFRHNEHIDVASDCTEKIQEVAEFGVSYLVDGRWTAAVMNLRQPVELPTGFGPRPSMSFFLYNQDGSQAIARPYLDGVGATGDPGPSPLQGVADMAKYHPQENWDGETNAPSGNFVYDFDVFRFLVNDSWEEVLHHDGEGEILSGSIEALGEAFAGGRAVKVGIGGLCQDLTETDETWGHEVFVQTGSNYYYTDRRLFIAGSHPVVRVRPDVPLRYTSRGWDFGWLVLRSDGKTVYRRCDPYTLAFEDCTMKLPLRWFVR
jgi:hypothetical protein